MPGRSPNLTIAFAWMLSINKTTKKHKDFIKKRNKTEKSCLIPLKIKVGSSNGQEWESPLITWVKVVALSLIKINVIQKIDYSSHQ